MRFIKLEKLINLYDGYQRTFNIENYPLLLIHNKQGSHLFLNRCPHQQKPLGDNCLHDNTLRCPWHGLQFTTNGACLDKAQSQLSLQKFQLAYEGQFIGVYFQYA